VGYRITLTRFAGSQAAGHGWSREVCVRHDYILFILRRKTPRATLNEPSGVNRNINNLPLRATDPSNRARSDGTR